MSAEATVTFGPLIGALFLAYVLVTAWGVTDDRLWGWIMMWIGVAAIVIPLALAIIIPPIAFFVNGAHQ